MLLTSDEWTEIIIANAILNYVAQSMPENYYEQNVTRFLAE